MSAAITTDIPCDSCGVGNHHCVIHTFFEPRIRVARKYLKGKGWAYIWSGGKREDICPECQKENVKIY